VYVAKSTALMVRAHIWWPISATQVFPDYPQRLERSSKQSGHTGIEIRFGSYSLEKNLSSLTLFMVHVSLLLRDIGY